MTNVISTQRLVVATLPATTSTHWEEEEITSGAGPGRTAATFLRRASPGFDGVGVAKATSLAAISVLAMGIAGSASAQPLRLFHEAPRTSANWAGYTITALDDTQTFSSITGAWTQPTASCPDDDAETETYAAFWVGLGGYSEMSQRLEQIGSEADCASGSPLYRVWYELLPAPSVTVKLKLYPGNKLVASVTVTGMTVTLTLSNLTRKTRFTKKLPISSPDVSSAEWIAEAPSVCAGGWCPALPLSPFGTVTFTDSTATTTAGLTGTISNPAYDATPLQLVTDPYPQLGRSAPAGDAITSDLSADGSSFTVNYTEATTPTQPVAPSGEP